MLPSILISSKETKPDKDSIAKEALSNARMWEARFAAADKGRQEYRNNAKRLITQNDKLQGAVEQVREGWSSFLWSTVPRHRRSATRSRL